LVSQALTGLLQLQALQRTMGLQAKLSTPALLLSVHHRLSGRAASGQRGTINLGEIAYRCGFASQSLFSVNYKKRFGVPPRKTRPEGA